MNASHSALHKELCCEGVLSNYIANQHAGIYDIVCCAFHVTILSFHITSEEQIF